MAFCLSLFLIVFSFKAAKCATNDIPAGGGVFYRQASNLYQYSMIYI
jgi:hypothetical protein